MGTTAPLGYKLGDDEVEKRTDKTKLGGVYKHFSKMDRK